MMTTVAKRTMRSCPSRDALETWSAISALLAVDGTEKRVELNSVAGIASSIIAEKDCENSPILVHCEGPQTRFYCIYDDDAIDGSDANEDTLGYDPLKGDWSVSLPCNPDDLDWVIAALADKSERITARDSSENSVSKSGSHSAAEALEIDLARFLKP